MCVGDDAIDVDVHGLVGQLEMVVHGAEFQRFRRAAERVGKQLRRTRGHFANEGLVATLHHDRQSFGDGRTQAAGVIEVMMRDDRLGEWLAGTSDRALSITALAFASLA